jgi:hypothetical protein
MLRRRARARRTGWATPPELRAKERSARGKIGTPLIRLASRPGRDIKRPVSPKELVRHDPPEDLVAKRQDEQRARNRFYNSLFNLEREQRELLRLENKIFREREATLRQVRREIDQDCRRFLHAAAGGPAGGAEAAGGGEAAGGVEPAGGGDGLSVDERERKRREAAGGGEAAVGAEAAGGGDGLSVDERERKRARRESLAANNAAKIAELRQADKQARLAERQVRNDAKRKEFQAELDRLRAQNTMAQIQAEPDTPAWGVEPSPAGPRPPTSDGQGVSLLCLCL